MTGNQVLSAHDITTGFSPDKPVIAKVQLAVPSGSIVVLAGPNGAGKSTLIKAMARQLPVLAGQVLLNGEDIWRITPSRFASAVAYVPQTLEPPERMTVDEMVMLGRNPHQKWWQWYGSEKDKAVVEQALLLTEMQGHRQKYLSELSGGERQRASMATALAQEPAFMLLDEPTSHLDFRHQLELIALLKQLTKQRNIGCLIVLHDLSLIARIADHVVLLEVHAGEPSTVIASGAPDTVLSRDNLEKVFQVEVRIFRDPETGEPVYQPALKLDREIDSTSSD